MKGNKLFVKSMIITAVLSVATLMIVMFIGMRYFLDRVPISEIPKEEQNTETLKVPFNSTILGVVNIIDKEEIKVFDIEKKQEVTAKIAAQTKIKDSYGKNIAIREIQVGDLVQLVYEPKEEQLLEIQEHTQGWTKTDMKNVAIDRSNREIKIGQNTYHFSAYTLMFNANGEKTDIYNIGDYDVLEFKGMDKDIYSIRVLEEQGYVQLEGLPQTNGILEIDINRQLPLSSATSPVPVTVGEHKLTVKLEGYTPKTQIIDIKPGETLILTMDDLERTFTELQIDVLNPEIDYTIKVGDKAYTKDDKIRVESGNYKIEITAPGHLAWIRNLQLEEPTMTLQVRLTPIPGTEEEPEQETTPDNGSNQNNGQDVSISTDPSNAKVYINDNYVGMTPYTSTLAIGDYPVRLEKEGYKAYETRVLIDNSNSQNKYLYMLIPE